MMRSLAYLFAILSLVLLVVIVVQMDGLAPLGDQPFQLTSASEISGEMSITLSQDDMQSYTTTVENQNGIPNTIVTNTADYGTPELAHAAHVAAINRWLADDTAGA